VGNVRDRGFRGQSRITSTETAERSRLLDNNRNLTLPLGMFLIQAPSPKWPNSANVYVIEDDDGIALIDVGCGSMEHFSQLVTGLEVHGLCLQQVHTVVLSHAHADHMGAISDLVGINRPRIYISETELEYAIDPELLRKIFDDELVNHYYKADYNTVAFTNAFSCPLLALDPGLEIHTVSHGDLITIGDFRFEVVVTPGHSPGHISLHEADKGLLYTGDIIGDVVTWYTPTAGGIDGFLLSLERLENLGASIMLPSHGGLISDTESAISLTRETLLTREHAIIAELKKTDMSFYELNKLVFGSMGKANLEAFSCRMLESHLIKLVRENKIERSADGVELHYKI